MIYAVHIQLREWIEEHIMKLSLSDGQITTSLAIITTNNKKRVNEIMWLLFHGMQRHCSTWYYFHGHSHTRSISRSHQLTHNHVVEMANRTIPNTICMLSVCMCVCVMRTLTYGFRRWLVRTFPLWLFRVHCLRQYLRYTTHNQFTAHIFLLLIFHKFRIFGFQFFPKKCFFFMIFVLIWFLLFLVNWYSNTEIKCNFKWCNICLI